jgi:DNA-binding protein H-NS
MATSAPAAEGDANTRRSGADMPTRAESARCVCAHESDQVWSERGRTPIEVAPKARRDWQEGVCALAV